MDIKARIITALERGHLMSLATSDIGGLWVADLIYIFDKDLNIYWMSRPETRHSKAIEGDPRVAGSITVSNKSKEPNLGIQFSGTASKIDGPRFDLAKEHMKKRGHPEPKEQDDVLKGASWYVVKPKRIDLIDEENLGFKKMSVDL